MSFMDIQECNSGLNHVRFLWFVIEANERSKIDEPDG